MRVAIRTAVAFAALIPASAVAQPVVVTPKPGNGGWDVSYTSMFEKADAATGTALSTTEVPHESWAVGKRCTLGVRGDTPMAGSRKVYAPEFKLQAVQMVTDQKLSVAEAARRLGVTENLLHSWKKAVLKNGVDAFPGSGHLTPIEEENRRLKADVKRLEAERDILKKATAFFAALTK